MCFFLCILIAQWPYMTVSNSIWLCNSKSEFLRVKYHLMLNGIFDDSTIIEINKKKETKLSANTYFTASTTVVTELLYLGMNKIWMIIKIQGTHHFRGKNVALNELIVIIVYWTEKLRKKTTTTAKTTEKRRE